MQQKTVVQKTAAFVRAGMMQPPKWYAATKQVRSVMTKRESFSN